MNRQVSEEFLPIKCYVDDKALIDSIYSTKTVTEKRLQVDICIVCEMIAKNEVTSVECAKVNHNLQIVLTKGTANCMKLLRVLKGNTGLLE